MEAEPGLSVAAQRCRDARLPELLRAVRRRGERRRRRRAAVVVTGGALLLVVADALWPRAGRSPVMRPPSGASARDAGASPLASAPAATIHVVVAGSVPEVAAIRRDDPAIVARCAVATQAHDAWFVDDTGLRALLRADGRPDGIVRIAGRVFVGEAAIDSYDAP